MTVAVVGASSLIAQALRLAEGTDDWRFMHYVEAIADPSALADVDLLINCAFDPGLKAGCYDPARDADLQLARRVAAHTRLVMLSSRLAYGPAGAEACLHEDRPPRPDRLYGINKLRTEDELAALLGDRLTVLRLSNVFGDEDRPGRQNFFAQALRSLRAQGRIVLDMSPYVERDFIPVDALAEHLVRISRAPQAGLYNLGAGTAVPTGRIAQWLIEGHGGGELLVTDLREFDAFRMDIAAAGRAFGIEPVPLHRIRRACVDLGRSTRQHRRGVREEMAV